jgi:hypothetical protein
MCLVSFYDIDKGELVVVRQVVAASSLEGDEPPRAILLARIHESAAGLRAQLRRGKAALLSAGDYGEDHRLDALGVSVKSAIRGPVLHGGRYLGLVELFDPLDGKPFTALDAHAVDYVAEQLGDFLQQHGVVLEPERVLRPKLGDLART